MPVPPLNYSYRLGHLQIANNILLLVNSKNKSLSKRNPKQKSCQLAGWFLWFWPGKLLNWFPRAASRLLSDPGLRVLLPVRSITSAVRDSLQVFLTGDELSIIFWCLRSCASCCFPGTSFCLSEATVLQVPLLRLKKHLGKMGFFLEFLKILTYSLSVLRNGNFCNRWVYL